MAQKVRTGPRGGKFVIQNGKKEYVGRTIKPSGYVRQPRIVRAAVSRTARQGSRRVTGKGGYKDWAGTAIRGAGALVGGAAGYYGGGPWAAAKGAMLGSGVGGFLSSLVGLGDYARPIKKNSLLGLRPGGRSTDSGMAPIMSNVPNCTIVTHREFIGNITGSTSFNLQSYAINPGLSSTFPWLAPIARNYQQHRWLGLIFQYKTTSVDSLNSSNTALGTVILATDYNAASPDFINKQAMQNTEYVTSVKPSASVLHPVECAPLETTVDVLYTRSGSVPPNEDIRLYDIGKFQLATEGQQAGVTVVGELWASYQIELLKPVVSSGGLSTESAHYVMDKTFDSTHSLGTTMPFVDPNSQGKLTEDTIGITFGTTDTAFDTIIFPPNASGDYLCVLTWRGAATASLKCPGVSIPDGYVGQVFVKQLWHNGTSIAPSSTLLYQEPDAEEVTSATGGIVLVMAFVVTIPNPGGFQHVLIDAGTLPGTPQYGDIFITESNSNMYGNLSGGDSFAEEKAAEKSILPSESEYKILLESVGNKAKLHELIVAEMVVHFKQLPLKCYAMLDDWIRSGFKTTPIETAMQGLSVSEPDYVDMSSSALFNLAVKKAITK